MNATFWERIRDWILLVILLIVSTSVMVGRNDSMVRALRVLSLDATARIESQFAWMGRYIRAIDENESLRDQNIELSGEVSRLREAQLENERLRSMLEFRESSNMEMVSARIVAKDLTRQENTLVIDAGSNQGVGEEMAVISEKGILGKVILAGANHSLVQAYLNTEFRISAKIQDIHAAGIVRWEGQRADRLLMEHVVRTEPVSEGQLVVTSGFSDIYPPGLPIGKITSVQIRQGRNEFLLTLEPSASLSTTEHAFVILRTPDAEVRELQEQFLN